MNEMKLLHVYELSSEDKYLNHVMANFTTGMKVTNSPPKSPSHKRSPKKSPTPSPTRGTKVPSSIPKALAQAAMTQPVSTQNGHLPAMENLDPATKRCGSSTLQV